jgi:hypothetical protein
MNFTVYNMDKVHKGRRFYYVCSDKENSPLALTSAGAQLVFDRVVRKSSRKRARLDENDDVENDNNNDDKASMPVTAEGESTPTSTTSTTSIAILQSTNEFLYDYTYWNSTNAAKLFAPKEGEQTILAVHRMIELCQQNAEKASSEHTIKYLLLRKAYQFA